MAISARRTVSVLTGIATALVLLAVAPTYAQGDDDRPRVISQSVEEGAAFAEVPYVFQLCFSEPVSLQGAGSEDSRFEIRTPEGRGLGKRISFQRDGLGVQIFPGGVPPLPPGFTPAADQTWTFTWKVTAQDDEASAEGTITFTLDDDGEVVPEESLPACFGESTDPEPTASGTDATDNLAGDEDDGTDVLYIVVLVAASIGALATVSIVGYLLKRRGGRGDGGPATGGTPPS